jgi:hypothetical protein
MPARSVGANGARGGSAQPEARGERRDARKRKNRRIRPSLSSRRSEVKPVGSHFRSDFFLRPSTSSNKAGSQGASSFSAPFSLSLVFSLFLSPHSQSRLPVYLLCMRRAEAERERETPLGERRTSPKGLVLADNEVSLSQSWPSFLSLTTSTSPPNRCSASLSSSRSPWPCFWPWP